MRRILVCDSDYALYDLHQYWEIELDDRADVEFRINIESEVRLSLSDGRNISYDEAGYWLLGEKQRLTPAVWSDFFKYDKRQFGLIKTFWRLLINNRNPDFAPD
jgi:hypothetical protein